MREQFRYGARNAVVRRIWTLIQADFYRELSQQGIAARLQISKGNITRWKRGEMSFEALVAVLADVCKQWADLPERPRNDVLRIAGLARMVGCRRKGDVRPENWTEQDYLEHLAIVCCLLPLMERLTRWRILAARTRLKSTAASELDQLVDEIVAQADERFSRFLDIVPVSGIPDHGEHPRRVPFRSRQDLSRLEQEYADVWDLLDDSSPYLEDEVDD